MIISIRSISLTLFMLALLALTACQEPQDKQAEAKPAKLDPTEFREVEWVDLMPKADFEALSNPPSYLSEIEDGSPEDQIASQVSNAIATAADDRYQQALVSTEIVPEMDGQPIRVPGFIVPLEFNDQQLVTQFFLVPFFGACIHVPPPPPNQIIHVTSPQGVKQDELYTPYWISGILKSEINANEVATATYAMEAQYIEIYTE